MDIDYASVTQSMSASGAAARPRRACAPPLGTLDFDITQKPKRVQQCRDQCITAFPSEAFEIVDSGVIRGRGLAVTREVQAKTRLGEYGGTHTIQKKKATRQGVPFDPSVTVTWTDEDQNTHHICADPESNNLFRLINHDDKPNVKLVKDDDTIWVETIDTIAAGTELFLRYSDAFERFLLDKKKTHGFDSQDLFPNFPWEEALKHGSTADNVALCELSPAALEKLEEIDPHCALKYMIDVVYLDDEKMKTLSTEEEKQLLDFQQDNIFPYVHIRILFLICIHVHDRLINISCCHASTGSWAMVSSSRLHRSSQTLFEHTMRQINLMQVVMQNCFVIGQRRRIKSWLTHSRGYSLYWTLQS